VRRQASGVRVVAQHLPGCSLGVVGCRYAELGGSIVTDDALEVPLCEQHRLYVAAAVERAGYDARFRSESERLLVVYPNGTRERMTRGQFERLLRRRVRPRVPSSHR